MVLAWLAQPAQCRVSQAVLGVTSSASGFTLQTQRSPLPALLVSCLQAALSLVQEDLAERLAGILHRLQPEVRRKLLHVSLEGQRAACNRATQSNLSWLKIRRSMTCHIAASLASSQPAAASNPLTAPADGAPLLCRLPAHDAARVVWHRQTEAGQVHDARAQGGAPHVRPFPGAGLVSWLLCMGRHACSACLLNPSRCTSTQGPRSSRPSPTPCTLCCLSFCMPVS